MVQSELDNAVEFLTGTNGLAEFDTSNAVGGLIGGTRARARHLRPTFGNSAVTCRNFNRESDNSCRNRHFSSDIGIFNLPKCLCDTFCRNIASAVSDAVCIYVEPFGFGAVNLGNLADNAAGQPECADALLAAARIPV